MVIEVKKVEALLLFAQLLILPIVEFVEFTFSFSANSVLVSGVEF